MHLSTQIWVIGDYGDGRPSAEATLDDRDGGVHRRRDYGGAVAAAVSKGKVEECAEESLCRYKSNNRETL